VGLLARDRLERHIITGCGDARADELVNEALDAATS